MKLTLPFPPSVNTYWRRCKGRSGMYISEQGQKFTNSVISKHHSPKLIFSKENRLTVTIKLFPPDRRIRDVDNYAKGTLDAIGKANIYADDSQIDRLLIERHEKVKGGRCEVEIEVMSE